MTENKDILKNISLFRYLADEQLAEVAKAVLERNYQRGRFIFMEGEPGEAIFFVKTGRVKISKQTSDGREHILHFVHPGEIFAEVVLFGDEHHPTTYPATAEVVEDCCVGMIRNHDMERIIKASPDLAMGMLKILAARLRLAQRQINDLALMDVPRRMASMLLYLIAEQGIITPEGFRIEMSLTNQDLANMIGTSRETANRVLNDFRRQGIILVDKQQIVVLNVKKLKSWL